MRFKAVIFILMVLFLALGVAAESGARGYILSVPKESEHAREVRHRLVAQRRAGPMVICHRGAWAFAPENTLEAYSAAMDYGADGCEIDIQFTADDVPVCYHDSYLGRTVDAAGRVKDYTYKQLSGIGFYGYGTATERTGVPTFAAVVQLARERGMLLILDVKKPGPDESIIRILDEADAWDHVVMMYAAYESSLNGSKKLTNQNINSIWGYTWEPEKLGELLSKPDCLIEVEDPRLAASLLGRTPHARVPFPDSLYADALETNAKGDRGTAKLLSLGESVEGWSEAKSASFIKKSLDAESKPDASAQLGDASVQAILKRMYAVRRLGEAENKALLVRQLKSPGKSNNYAFVGLDSAAAARALVDSGEKDVLGWIVNLYDSPIPDINESFVQESTIIRLLKARIPYKRMLVAAVGDMKCDGGKAWLASMLEKPGDWDGQASLVRGMALDEALAVVTSAYVRQDLTEGEIVLLLADERTAVRETAVCYFLDHPSEAGDAALRSTAPWALELIRAVRD